MDFKKGFRLVIFLGLVSLFADMTYEGARSIIGPYLATLGASATVVGFVAGLGEFIGYGLRLISGYISDKLKKYWSITLIGYAINLFSVPFLALAKNWIQAVFLVLTERLGKAIRTPARDTILSYITSKLGRGKGFGFHEAMDQIGAITGPLIVSAVLFFTQSYKASFAILIIPAFLALIILIVVMSLCPQPQRYEKKSFYIKNKGFSKNFWIYTIAIGIYAGGFADFALIAYHFKKMEILNYKAIPIFYAIAMGVDAISALIFGFLFDKKGISVLIVAVLISSLSVPLVFLGNYYLVLLGLILWGAGMGAQESIIRAVLPFFVSKEKRATGYGIFNAFYGFFWFLGSTLLGFLYDISIYTLITASITLQLFSIPPLIVLSKSKV